MYTVKQLAKLTGVTPRTLHYYDEIALLAPTRVGANGYRYYGDAALLRLQQILLYRALGVPLAEIGALLDGADFDVLAALRAHRTALLARQDRLASLLRTVDYTIDHLTRSTTMQPHRLFDGLDEATRQRYAEEAERRYDPATVRAANAKWQGYGKDRQDAIRAEGETIYAALAAAMPTGPASAEVQALLGRWRRHLEHYWTPQPAQLRALAATYVDDPRFKANFDKLHPDLAAFMQDAVAIYVEAGAP
jgi:DNA-binding transcriptional MerR regulator